MPGVSTLPEVANLVAARGGGGGARPQDPAALAARALNAAMGDDKETALRLYDYGMETYGPTFAATYNTLRDQRELATAAVTPSEPGVLRKVASAAADAVKVGDEAGYSTGAPPATGYEIKPLSGLPHTEGGKGGIIGAGGLPRSPAGPPATFVAEPGQPVAVPPPGGSPMPVAADKPLITVGDDTGMPPVPESTGYRMQPPSGLPHTEGGKGGVFGAGGLPDAGGLPRSPQVQGPPWQTNSVELERAAPGSAYRESIIPTPGQPVVVPDAPQIPVLRPDRNESNTRIAQASRGSATEEAVARGVPVEQVEAERAKDLKDAQAADAARNPVPTSAAAAAAVPPAPPAEPAPASTGVITSPGAPVPGGDTTASSTGVVTPGGAPAPAASRSVPVPDITLPDRQPYPKGKYGLQPDGSYIDPPPGGEVIVPEDTPTIVKKTGQPARQAGDPSAGQGPVRGPAGARSAAPNQNVAAPPGSGGLVTLVTPPPAGGGTVTSTTTIPGGGAIVPATTPAAAAADPAAAAASEKAGYADFMGEPNIWSFLTSAGLGALTSESPTALGAIGAGGTEGIKQLGTLRKEKRERLADQNLAAYRKETSNIAREQNANTVNIANQSNALGRERLAVDERQGKDSISVQREGITAGNWRTQAQIDSSEREAELNRQSQGQNLNTQIQANLALKGMDITSQRDLQIERGKIEMQMQAFKQELENNGKVVQREDMFNFLTTDPKGPKIDPKVAGTMVAGFGPQKPDAFKPLGDKDVTLAHTSVAASLFGEGVTAEQLLAAIPPAFQAGYLQAIGTAEDAATAAARGLAFFMSKGLDPRNEATFGGVFGDDWKLRIHRTPAAAPPATQRYDPATKKMVPAQ